MLALGSQLRKPQGSSVCPAILKLTSEITPGPYLCTGKPHRHLPTPQRFLGSRVTFAPRGEMISLLYQHQAPGWGWGGREPSFPGGDDR